MAQVSVLLPDGSRRGGRKDSPRTPAKDDPAKDDPTKDEEHDRLALRLLEVETSMSEVKDTMLTEEKMAALLEKLVLNASTTAVQTAYSTKPIWAKDLENLLMKTKEKADDAEDAAEALNIRLTQFETCTFSIALAEKTAKRTTARQSRIYNHAKGRIEKHLKDKLPNISVPTFEKEGNVMIASFKTKKEAATFAKSVNEDKLSNGEKKTIYVKPQLPPEVVASQAPLKRALAAYKATIDPNDDNKPYMHWESRSVIHNKVVVIE